MNLKELLEKNLRTGMTELLILNFLKEADCYVFELINMLKERTHNVFSFERESNIYLILHRMEDNGLISSYSVKVNHVRRYYHIEKDGIDYLEYGRKFGCMVCTEFLENMRDKD